MRLLDRLRHRALRLWREANTEVVEVDRGGPRAVEAVSRLGIDGLLSLERDEAHAIVVQASAHAARQVRFFWTLGGGGPAPFEHEQRPTMQRGEVLAVLGELEKWSRATGLSPVSTGRISSERSYGAYCTAFACVVATGSTVFDQALHEEALATMVQDPRVENEETAPIGQLVQVALAQAGATAATDPEAAAFIAEMERLLEDEAAAFMEVVARRDDDGIERGVDAMWSECGRPIDERNGRFQEGDDEGRYYVALAPYSDPVRSGYVVLHEYDYLSRSVSGGERDGHFYPDLVVAFQTFSRLHREYAIVLEDLEAKARRRVEDVLSKDLSGAAINHVRDAVREARNAKTMKIDDAILALEAFEGRPPVSADVIDFAAAVEARRRRVEEAAGEEEAPTYRR